MRHFKNVLFFVILFMILSGMSNRIQTISIENDNFVQNRNKSIYRIMREPRNSVDVIVVGDSLSYSSVSPMELWKNHGISSYVCGQSGQMIQETFHMLENVFRSQSPKLIILETNVLFKGQSGMEGLKEIVSEWANHHFPLIRNHDIWKSLITEKKYIEESYNGFMLRCQVNSYVKGNYMIKTKEKQVIPDNVIKYMNQIMKLCERKGAELFLLSTPSPDNYNYSKHNGIEEYAREHSIKYLDMNLELNKIGINWETDSLDKGDHLNLSGAQKVTWYLGQYIADNYKMPDHRGEELYDSLEKKVQKYEKKIEKCLKKMKKKN